MNVSTKVRCPICGGKGAPVKGGALRCKRCHAIYDDKPNEHGRAVHTNPERNFDMLNGQKGNPKR